METDASRTDRRFEQRSMMRRSSSPKVVVRSTSVISIFALIVVSCAPSGMPGVQARSAAPTAATASAESARDVLDQYCVACHNERAVNATGEPESVLDSRLRATGLAFDALDVTRPSADADAWERVIKRLRAGSMPPAGRPRPDETTSRAMVGWLEASIDQVASSDPNPGRNSSVHRLNRTEYGNVIRDLFALEMDVVDLLPGDETSDTGFDNNADVLSISTSQLERYLSAARKITRLATGLSTRAEFVRFQNHGLLSQFYRQSEELPLGSRGGLAARYEFPADGEYLFTIELASNWQDYIRGMGRRNQIDLRIDGELVQRFTVGGEAPGTPAPLSFSPAQAGSPEWEEYVRYSADRLQVSARVDGGPHVVGASLLRRMWEPEGILQPHMVGQVLNRDEMYHGNAQVEALTIEGPYDVEVPGDTPSRRKIFVCYPTGAAEEEPCATQILSRLARLAYRGPVTEEDLRILFEFFEDGRAEGGSFEAGIQLALERMLADPHFLLRVQADPVGSAPGQVYNVGDLDVASRLSFFLWSSIPDEELLDLAERGRLTDPAVLRGQVRRMLADTRSQTLVENFAVQWLHLRSVVDVDAESALFASFDRELVEAFSRETELFIASTIREDRSVLDLIGADYTFVNERLARHYGIAGVYGSRFRRVTLPNPEQRGGLLAHGSVLSLTSHPNRTSPVLRGRWLLETIFGTPPPAPPANVPNLPETGEDRKPASVRERLELHRTNPVCASCHRTIDPLGFALENFDAIGAWRTLDEGQPVDSKGTLPDGTTIEGVSGLRQLLLDRPELFVSTFTERLLAYAIGRQPEYYDQPTVRQVMRKAADDGYRWSSLIIGIIESPAFLMRRAAT